MTNSTSGQRSWPTCGGRPRQEVVVSVDDLQALQARNQELERQLAEMRARVELAILPFLGNGKRARRKRPDSDPGA